MPYLLPTEYAAFGLETRTSEAWTALASSLIDAHCRRVSLLVTTYTERRRLAAGRLGVRLSYRPLAVAAGAASPLVSARVRYSPPRGAETPEDSDPFLARVAEAFRLPGSWSALDVAAIEVDTTTAELTLPCSYLGLGFNEVEIAYTAGFAVIPDAIKTACAQIVRNAQATPALNVKSHRVDAVQMEYFSGVLIDPGVETLLRPYVAERIG